MRNAFRAGTIVTLSGESPARGLADLDKPLKVMDDAVLVLRDGMVEAVESRAAFRRRSASDCRLTDLGDVCLLPGLVNAHCHLELSHLAGKVSGGRGFADWLRNLLAALRDEWDPARPGPAMALALQALQESGAAHTGDVGSRLPAEVAGAASALAAASGLPYPVTHFLEVMGFARPQGAARMPEELDAGGYTPPAAAGLPGERHADCAVSGHALYSTGPKALQAAFAWCAARAKPFSLHLAESTEEEECLLYGTGALHDLLSARILPTGWKAPGKRPVPWARSLGLLSPRTLAVHAVHCDRADVDILAASGASVCLCPRSNDYIAVGRAPARRMAEAGLLLCIGTDSLSSNHSLDMRAELRAAREIHGFSFPAVLRMAARNAAHALGLNDMGTLEPGRRGCFFSLPMTDDLLR